MAELLLKTDAGSGYEPGDILCAFNARRIRCCHAENICHFRKANRNASGLIVASEVARDWYEATHEFRFERVSATEIERVTIATGARERLSDKPNAKGEAIDVRLFIARRKQNPLCPLFGEDGAEFWYGGRIDTSNAKLTTVWNAIQTKTPHRETSFQRWPMGTQELRSHLAIRVNEFDDVEAETLVAAEVDDTKPDLPVVQKRRNRVDWETRLSLTAADRQKVRDKSEAFDLREVRQYTRASIVTAKPPARLQRG